MIGRMVASGASEDRVAYTAYTRPPRFLRPPVIGISPPRSPPFAGQQ